MRESGTQMSKAFTPTEAQRRIVLAAYRNNYVTVDTPMIAGVTRSLELAGYGYTIGRAFALTPTGRTLAEHLRLQA